MAMVDNNSKILLAQPYIAKRIKAVESVHGKPLTLEKKVVLAHAMKNTNDRIKAFESTNPNALGPYKRYAIDILAATLPNAICFDLVAVQPLDNRVGKLINAA